MSNPTDMSSDMSVSLSTVTPVYQGAQYLEALVGELADLRERWESEGAPLRLVESIFVNDGAIDDSGTVLQSLSERYSWITVVNLSRNVGQHSATVAGICHSSSDWVVTLDEDLQHRPEIIPLMLSGAVNAGADVCYACPINPVHGGGWRDRASMWTKSLIARMADSEEIRSFNSFRLIRGSIARAAAASSSSQTYLDIALSWYTNTYATVQVDMEDERYTRDKGSGYGLGRLIRHARHLLVSSSLDIASKGLVVGAAAVILAALLAVAVVIQKLLFPETIDSVGWTSLVAITSFFGGVMIALLCLAIEYLNVLVLNQLGKPTFFTVDRSSDEVLREWLGR